MNNKFSVVVCAKNEEQRLARALDSIKLNNPDEIIIVDGNSTDRTVEISHQYTSNVIVSQAGGLTWDRQIGIDKASNNLIVMIDADHILAAGDIDSLIKEMIEFEYKFLK